MYLTPYITCGRCNALNFVNSNLLHDVVKRVETELMLNSPGLLPMESMPPCVRCKCTLDLRLGALDLKEELVDNSYESVQHVWQRQHAAAVQIQRIIRGRNGRGYAAEQRRSRHRLMSGRVSACICIQARVRGIIDRRWRMVQSAAALIEVGSSLKDKILFNFSSCYLVYK